jgi:hypothetical protein
MTSAEPARPPAPQPSYENVEPLLHSSRVDGAIFECVFRCPQTGAEVTGSSPMPDWRAPDVSQAPWWTPRRLASGEGTFLAGEAADKVVKGASGVLWAADALRDLRRSRRDLKQTAETSAAAAAHAQGELPRQMIVTAFASVAHEFAWDGASGRWIKAGP